MAKGKTNADRFRVNPRSPSGGSGGSEPDDVLAALLAILEVEKDVLEAVQKGRMTADEGKRQLQSANSSATSAKANSGISTESGLAQVFDELGAGIGAPAYKAARAMRYVDRINKAGGLGEVFGKAKSAFGMGGESAAGEAGAASKAASAAGRAGGATGAASKAAGAAGGASGAAGAAGTVAGAELAAVAGPIGAVVGLAKMAADEVAGLMKGYAKAFDQSAEIVSRVAQNDAFGAMNVAVDGAAEAVAKIPIIGDLWAAQLKATIAPLNAFNKVLAAVAARGEEISGYDGRIAQASAMAEVRGIAADIREANKFGDSYASLISSQSRIETNLQDALAPIKSLLFKTLEPLAKLAEIQTRHMARGADFAERMIEQTERDFQRMFDLVKGIPGLGKIAEDLMTKWNQQTEMEKGEMLAARSILLGYAGNVGIEDTAIDPAADAAEVGIGFPLFN